MQTLVSNKAFENKGLVLRPFRARDAEAESIIVGRALGLKSHTPSTQKTLLEKELLFMANAHIRSLPFSCQKADDVLSLFLLLSGAKPASILATDGKPPLLPATKLHFGECGAFYAKCSISSLDAANLLLARDIGRLEQLGHLLASGEKNEKPGPDANRAIGACLGYPEGAAEQYSLAFETSSPSKEFIRILLSGNFLVAPSIWNAPYVPEVREGQIIGQGQLGSWNDSLARTLPLIAYVVASAYRKVSMMESMIANMQDRDSWGESRSERALRRAIQQAY